MRTDNAIIDYKNKPSYHELEKEKKRNKLVKNGLISMSALGLAATIALSAPTLTASIPSTSAYDSTREKIELRQVQETKNNLDRTEQTGLAAISMNSSNNKSNMQSSTQLAMANMTLEEIMAQEQKITYSDLKKEITPQTMVKDIEYVTYRGPHINSIKDLAEKRGYHVYEKGKNKEKKIIINTYLKPATTILVRELKLNYRGLEKTLKKFTRKEEIQVYSPAQEEELVALSCIERGMQAELCLSNMNHESRRGHDEISTCKYKRMNSKKKILYQTRILSAAGPLMVNVWGNDARFIREYNTDFTWDALLRNTPLAIDLGNDILKEQLDKYKRIDFALATYNGGDSAIKKGKIVKEESKNHARKVMETMKEYKRTGYADEIKDRLKKHAINIMERPRLAQNE